MNPKKKSEDSLSPQAKRVAPELADIIEEVKSLKSSGLIAKRGYGLSQPYSGQRIRTDDHMTVNARKVKLRSRL